MNIKKFRTKKAKDIRGSLIQLLKASNLKSKKFGELYIITINPGRSRGNHFHKKAIEWFFCIKGEIILTLKKNNEEKKIKLSDKKPMVIQIDTGIVHTIHNKTSKEVTMLAYSSEDYNKRDTYFLKIGNV